MSYQSILVPVDLDSSESLNLLGKIPDLQASAAKVHLLHVGSIMAALFPVSGMGASQPSSELEAFQKEYTQELNTFLQQLAQKSPVPIESTHVKLGKVSTEVKELAKKLECDLIVIGQHSDKKLERVLGSNANAILHAAPCDVLTVFI